MSHRASGGSTNHQSRTRLCTLPLHTQCRGGFSRRRPCSMLAPRIAVGASLGERPLGSTAVRRCLADISEGSTTQFHVVPLRVGAGYQSCRDGTACRAVQHDVFGVEPPTYVHDVSVWIARQPVQIPRMVAVKADHAPSHQSPNRPSSDADVRFPVRRDSADFRRAAAGGARRTPGGRRSSFASARDLSSGSR